MSDKDRTDLTGKVLIMDRKRNYQKELDRMIETIEAEGHTPRLLLHSCCAPCSTYVLEYLSRYFMITDYYYNPNITEREEYIHRLEELDRLIREMSFPHPVEFMAGRFEPERFFESVRGLEDCAEGEERCRACFRLRLSEAAKTAADGGFDYVTTTLSISPLKNAEVLNRIGEEEAGAHGVKWLPCDFKKKGGYQRSTELSREYGLYRQNYCGCVFSKR